MRGPRVETSPSLPTGPPATEKKKSEASSGAVSVFDLSAFDLGESSQSEELFVLTDTSSLLSIFVLGFNNGELS